MTMRTKVLSGAILATMLTVAITSVCWPATYFVSSTAGNDNNTGLAATSAWKTIAKVNASSFAPGDQILFKGGEVWRENLVPPSSGSSGSPITFGSYSSGARPLILGSDARTGTTLWTLESSGIWYTGGINWTPKAVFHNGLGGSAKASKTALASTWDWWYDATNYRIYIYNPNNPGNSVIEVPKRTGIGYSASNFIKVNNVEIAFADVGIGLWGGSNWTIDKAYIHDVTVSGIQGNNGSRFVTVQNSTFQDWNWHGYLAPKGAGESYMGYGIQVISTTSGTNSDQWRITNNRLTINNMASGEDSTAINIDQQGHASSIENNYIDGKGATNGGGIMFWRPKSTVPTVIRGNSINNSGAMGINVSEFNVNNFTANVLIERNVLSNICLQDNLDQEALRIWTASSTAVTIDNNLINQTAKGQNNHNGINIRQSVNITAFNNTIYGTDIGINVERYSTATLVNNIAAGSRAAALNVDSTSTCLEKYNDLFGAVTGIAPASTTIGQDPMFVASGQGNFRLSSGSPAATAGINMGTGIYDLDNVLAPSVSSWSMGAYQRKVISPPGVQIQ